MNDWRAPLKRIAGIYRRIEASLAKLDRAHERHRAGGRSIGERKVGMLISLSHKRTQITALEAILGNDLHPNVRIVPNVCREAAGLIAPNIYAQRLGHCRPHAPPLEDVAVGDIEDLVDSCGACAAQTMTSPTRSASAASQTNDGPPGKPNGSPFSRRIAA